MPMAAPLNLPQPPSRTVSPAGRVGSTATTTTTPAATPSASLPIQLPTPPEHSAPQPPPPSMEPALPQHPPPASPTPSPGSGASQRSATVASLVSSHPPKARPSQSRSRSPPAAHVYRGADGLVAGRPITLSASPARCRDAVVDCDAVPSVPQPAAAAPSRTPRRATPNAFRPAALPPQPSPSAGVGRPADAVLTAQALAIHKDLEAQNVALVMRLRAAYERMDVLEKRSEAEQTRWAARLAELKARCELQMDQTASAEESRSPSRPTDAADHHGAALESCEGAAREGRSTTSMNHITAPTPDVAVLHAMVASLRGEVATAVAARERLQQLCDAKDIDIESLKSEGVYERDVHTSLQAALKEALREEEQKVDGMAAAHLEELAALREVHASELAAARASAAELQDEQSQVHEEFEHLRMQLEAVRRRADHAEQVQTAVAAEADAAEHAHLAERTALQATIADLTATVTRLEGEAESLRRAAVPAPLPENDEEPPVPAADHAYVQRENAHLHAQLRDATDAIQHLRDELRAVSAARDDAVATAQTLTAQAREVHQLRTVVAAKDQHIAEATGEAATLRGMLGISQDAIRSAVEERGRHKAELKRQRAANAALTREVERLQREMEASRAQSAQRERERAASLARATTSPPATATPAAAVAAGHTHSPVQETVERVCRSLVEAERACGGGKLGVIPPPAHPSDVDGVDAGVNELYESAESACDAPQGGAATDPRLRATLLLLSERTRLADALLPKSVRHGGGARAYPYPPGAYAEHDTAAAPVVAESGEEWTAAVPTPLDLNLPPPPQRLTPRTESHHHQAAHPHRPAAPLRPIRTPPIPMVPIHTAAAPPPSASLRRSGRAGSRSAQSAAYEYHAAIAAPSAPPVSFVAPTDAGGAGGYYGRQQQQQQQHADDQEEVALEHGVEDSTADTTAVSMPDSAVEEGVENAAEACGRRESCDSSGEASESDEESESGTGSGSGSSSATTLTPRSASHSPHPTGYAQEVPCDTSAVERTLIGEMATTDDESTHVATAAVLSQDDPADTLDALCITTPIDALMPRAHAPDIEECALDGRIPAARAESVGTYSHSHSRSQAASSEREEDASDRPLPKTQPCSPERGERTTPAVSPAPAAAAAAAAATTASAPARIPSAVFSCASADPDASVAALKMSLGLYSCASDDAAAGASALTLGNVVGEGLAADAAAEAEEPTTPIDPAARAAAEAHLKEMERRVEELQAAILAYRHPPALVEVSGSRASSAAAPAAPANADADGTLSTLRAKTAAQQQNIRDLHAQLLRDGLKPTPP